MRPGASPDFSFAPGFPGNGRLGFACFPVPGLDKDTRKGEAKIPRDEGETGMDCLI